MSTRKTSTKRAVRLSSAFDRKISGYLLGLRREVERPAKTVRPSKNLVALEVVAARLSELVSGLSARRAGDLPERLEELEYPFAKLTAHFAGKKTGLEHRAVEILAEYLRDRLLEIRIVAKELDAK
ncbi:MAG TPA: hypothetical protein VGK67_38630 [Myxococcales bacterium]|jgi:hypothetical protein